MEEALKRLVRIAVEAKKMHDFMEKNGYNDSPYTRIYDNAADAIYYLIGEDGKEYDTFDQSLTYIVLHSKASPELKTEVLLEELGRNVATK